MSRYTLSPIEEGVQVDIGYDAPLDTYYLQVRIPNDCGGTKLQQWRGNGAPDLETGGIITIPEVLVSDAAKYAVIPKGLIEALTSDRGAGPEDVHSDPVIYAGMPNKEVWRHRTAVDPATGVQMKIKPSSVYTYAQRISMAILRDFVNNEERARRIVQIVSANVIAKLMEKRVWLLTEQDMNRAVIDAEDHLGLRWLKGSKCYAGEGTRVAAEVQLRRAGRKCRLTFDRATSMDEAILASCGESEEQAAMDDPYATSKM